MCSSTVTYFYIHISALFTYQPTPVYTREDTSGVWDPVLDEDADKPLLQKQLASLTRSQLPCDWARHRHWCDLHHYMTCIRPEQVTENTTSIAFLTAGGRLGNAMSTYAVMLALRKQYGLDAMVDLTTFQLLDRTFVNVREVPVLEFRLCDKRKLEWISFERHISQLSAEHYGKGLAILTWPGGMTSEEEMHGAAQLMTPSIEDIRQAFRFRRTDHIIYEKINGVVPLTGRYFKQAMELYHDNLKHPIFVIVTDDPQWAETELNNFFKVHFTGFYSVASPDSAGLDLAVLTLCNHIVRSRGTFGLWGVILAGTSSITPKHYLSSLVGRPLELRNQVPLFDLSPRWMSEGGRAALRERCPQCLLTHPANSSLLPGTDVIVP